MPELRKDPVVNRWVIISPERGKRPHDFPSPPRRLNPGTCPFCPGHEFMTPPEILAYRPEGSAPDTPGWTLRVVPNKFPALQGGPVEEQRENDLYDKMNGLGAHEVIIETPEHPMDLPGLPVARMEDFFRSWKERIGALGREAGFRYILIFKNYGEPSGASLEHAHSQLIALPIIPELVSEEIAGARLHHQKTRRCIYCDLIAREQEDGRRVVAENEGFLCLSPYAARFPFEMWLLPKGHAGRFEESDLSTITQLAQMAKTSLIRMREALDDPPYNFYLHTSPLHEETGTYYHWHIEIMPKLTKLAGFEKGTGFYINPTLPEEAAAVLRNIKL